MTLCNSLLLLEGLVFSGHSPWGQDSLHCEGTAEYPRGKACDGSTQPGAVFTACLSWLVLAGLQEGRGPSVLGVGLGEQTACTAGRLLIASVCFKGHSILILFHI